MSPLDANEAQRDTGLSMRTYGLMKYPSQPPARGIPPRWNCSYCETRLHIEDVCLTKCAAVLLNGLQKIIQSVEVADVDKSWRDREDALIDLELRLNTSRRPGASPLIALAPKLTQ